MKIIPLSKGRVANVDDADHARIAAHSWYAYHTRGRWYALRDVQRNLKKTVIRMHREVMGAVAGEMIDHADRNGLNNTRSNLRFCTPQQNNCNTIMNCNNTSGYRGVHYVETTGRWAAQISVNGKRLKIGYYDDRTQAAIAYDEAAIRYHGEFASLNYPTP